MSSPKQLPVFYTPAQSTADNDSFSPSAGKPAALMAEIREDPRVRIISGFPPLRTEEIALAHDPSHVEAILAGEKENGFSNRSAAVAATLPWTNGSFYQAARHAATEGGFSFSPTSGFHHAEHDAAMGFCTFNGLMIATVLLQREGVARKIGIVDLDVHYGNGTDDIVRRLGIGSLEHLSFADVTREVNRSGSPWHLSLEEILERDFADRELIMYQAGADPHVDDPLGGELTGEELRLRDRAVFRFAAERDIPLVWNLAGGYQRPLEKVLALHLTTLEECLAAAGRL